MNLAQRVALLSFTPLTLSAQRTPSATEVLGVHVITQTALGCIGAKLRDNPVRTGCVRGFQSSLFSGAAKYVQGRDPRAGWFVKSLDMVSTALMHSAIHNTPELSTMGTPIGPVYLQIRADDKTRVRPLIIPESALYLTVRLLDGDNLDWTHTLRVGTPVLWSTKRDPTYKHDGGRTVTNVIRLRPDMHYFHAPTDTIRTESADSVYVQYVRPLHRLNQLISHEGVHVRQYDNGSYIALFPGLEQTSNKLKKYHLHTALLFGNTPLSPMLILPPQANWLELEAHALTQNTYGSDTYIQTVRMPKPYKQQ